MSRGLGDVYKRQNMAYVKLMLVGSLMLFSLKYNPKGLLPEVPSRPARPTDSGGESE